MVLILTNQNRCLILGNILPLHVPEVGKGKELGVISSSVLAQPRISPKHAVSCAWDESSVCRPPTSLGTRPGPFILMVSSPRPALGRVRVNKACLLKKWSGNGEGQKTEGEISGQKSAALSQLGDCDRCCGGHTEERWWDVGIPLFTYSHDRPFFGSTTMCIPLCSRLGVQQWASLTPMIVLSSFLFSAKDRFSQTNYVNRICPVVWFQNDSLRMPVSVRSPNRQKDL